MERLDFFFKSCRAGYENRYMDPDPEPGRNPTESESESDSE